MRLWRIEIAQPCSILVHLLVLALLLSMFLPMAAARGPVAVGPANRALAHPAPQAAPPRSSAPEMGLIPPVTLMPTETLPPSVTFPPATCTTASAT